MSLAVCGEKSASLGPEYVLLGFVFVAVCLRVYVGTRRARDRLSTASHRVKTMLARYHNKLDGHLKVNKTNIRRYLLFSQYELRPSVNFFPGTNQIM